MSTSPEQVADRLRAEAALASERDRARAAQLVARCDEAARLLKSEGASTVWLFGSLVSGFVHGESDVDLAVLGLPRAAYFDVLSRLTALFEGRVDLVRLEDAASSLRERVTSTGREL